MKVTSPTERTTRHAAPVRSRRRVPVLLAAVTALVLVAAGVALVMLQGRDAEPPPAAAPALPRPTPPAPAAAPVAASGRTVSVLDSGATGDGRTDDTGALRRAFAAARRGDVVELPAGRTFAHAGVVTVSTPGITITGGGTLLATDEQRSSFTIAADDVTLEGLTLRIAPTSKRWDAYEQQRLRLDGHRGIVVRDVEVDGSAAAGVYVGGGTAGFVLDRVRVVGTRADGIHITQGAHDGRVISPQVTNVGDDGVAVVSYAADGPPCARIEVDTPRVDGSSGGRGVSVVGGTDITYRDVDVRRTYAAGVYVATESSFGTGDVHNVFVDGGSVTDANVGTDIDHGAVLVFNGTKDKVVSDVEVAGLRIEGTRPTASRVVGLVTDKDRGIANVALLDLTLSAAGASQPFVSNQTSTTYRLSGWTVNGQPAGSSQNGMADR